MAAGLVSSPLDMSDIATLIDQREGPGKSGGYTRKGNLRRHEVFDFAGSCRTKVGPAPEGPARFCP